jgi:hypothetical protein
MIDRPRQTAPRAVRRQGKAAVSVASLLERAQRSLERPRVAGAVLAVLAVFFLWQCWAAASRWSMTSDEVVHIPAGYIYWTVGDFSFNAEHPPLAKLIAAIPLLITAPKLPILDGIPMSTGYRFCFVENQVRSVLLWPRLMISFLSLLTGLVVFAWGRRLVGVGAAVVAVALLFFEPNITAHSALVTTDAPLTLFFVATVASFWWCVEVLTWPRVAVFAAAFSAAMVTKFSAVLLVPILVALAIPAALLTAELPQRLWRPQAGAPPPLGTPRSRLLALLGVLLVAGAVCYGAIWATYGFSFGADDVGDTRKAANAETIIESVRKRGVKIATQPYVFFDRHRLLPHAYIAGLIDVARHNAVGHHAFLLGERSLKGWPQYFAVTFLVKTPLPLLLLLAVGLALLRTRVLARLELAFLFVPVGIYALVAVGSHLNIGHRHLLPIVPFIVLIAAAALPALERVGQRWRGRMRTVVALLLLWCGFEAVRYRPHFLSYFNQLAGGPEEGYKVLVDSNLDWGQDLYLLKEWVDVNHVKDLKVSYFGPALPDDDAGIPCVYVTPPRIQVHPIDNKAALRDGDLFAISATYLQGIMVVPTGAFDFLRQYRPVARVGYTIFIYRIADTYLLSP